jgi:hypothetical protein
VVAGPADSLATRNALDVLVRRAVKNAGDGRGSVKMPKTNHLSVKEILDPIFTNWLDTEISLVGEFSTNILSDQDDERKRIAIIKLDAAQALEARFTEAMKKVVGEDEEYPEAHKTNSCKGCNVFERNELRAEMRQRIDQVIKENFGGRDE